ncbi:MAG: 7-cyano-7-deazaguanine synthase, partial [Dehalococcoidia bacterium]
MFVPGRNILLIALAAVWCSTHDVSRIAIGSLGGNPFPDATPEFFSSFGTSLSSGLGHEINIEAPFRDRKKSDLIRSYSDLPIELSLTCAQPTGANHCGNCNKCTERQQAFVEAGIEDRTKYLV